MSSISDKYKHDYKSLDYSNPRLAREKEKKRNALKRVLLILSGIIAAGLFYLFCFSPVFIIKEIEIQGLNKIKRENIDSIVNKYRSERKWFIFSRKNILFFNTKEIKKKITEHYWFENLEIEKDLPDKVTIKLIEKESAINWMTNNVCFHLDLTGTPIEYCESAGGLITIKDLKNAPMEIGKSSVPKYELDYLINLDQQLKLVTENKFKLMYYEKQDNMLTVKTDEQLVLLLNENIAAEEQAMRLRIILDQADVKGNWGKLNYIDLRFGDRVYYK